jgi:ribosomal-protein-alanine N-acetyltransferase
MSALVETIHLSLRRPTSEDALILKDLWRNEKIREFLGGTLPEDAIAEKIAALQAHWDRYGFGLWSVWKKNSEWLIGLCGLHHTEDGLELSYLFFPEYWGQGLARETVHASLNYGFTVLKQNAIISITQEANLGSCHLLGAVGMKLIHKFNRFNALQCLYKLHQDDYLRMLKT